MLTPEQRLRHTAVLVEFITIPEPTNSQCQGAAASAFVLIGQALLDFSRIADALEKSLSLQEEKFKMQVGD